MGIPVYIGISFGIFFAISCSTTEKTSHSASDDFSTTESYENQLEQINRDINNNSDRAELYFEKAELLLNYARSRNNPSERLKLYQLLFDTSIYGIENFSEYSNQFQFVLNDAWNTEESSAVQLLQEDRSENFEHNFDRIVSHLKNAITVKPEELVSYSLLATTYYKRGYYNEAVNTLTDALFYEENSEHESEIKEKLAYLYLESGEYDQSISLYEELAEEETGAIYIKHGLANAYMLNEQHEKASELLKSLSEEYPSRVTYREALATEYFKLFLRKADLLINKTVEDAQEEATIEELLTLLDLTNSIYLELNEIYHLSEESAFRTAVFYKSASEKLDNLNKSSSLSSDLEDELSVMAEEYLQNSLSFWETLAEISPENMEYMYNLYQVYKGLDMAQEYQQLERNFNF